MNNNNFKLLILTGYFYPTQIGGPSISIYWLSKELVNNKIDVSILALKNRIEVNGIIFDKLLKTNYGSVFYINNKYINFSIKYIFQGIKLIQRNDIIQINSFFSPNSFILAFYCILTNKNIIWSPRGEFSKSALKYKNIYKKILIYLFKFFQKNIYFHVTSEYEKQQVLDIFPFAKDIFIIPNYIELPNKSISKKLNQILYIGRIHPIKAIEVLIKACENSKIFSNKKCKLLIIGDNKNEYGIYLKKLANGSKISDLIIFKDNICDGNIKNEIYKKSLCTILPSHSENFGNVVVESLSNSTFVIASKGTPWEILNDYNAGLWVDNNVYEISNAIDKILLMTEDTLFEVSNNAYNLASDKFSIKNNINNWIDIYNKLINFS